MKPEKLYKNFYISNVRKVPELPCELVEVTHLPTGAKIIHIPSDDQENFFCISLKTLPSSSNGVAHILEHLSLCGSKHFPVKDPFFSMTRRSMNTFMNAFTGTDFTCYPAASQIEKDFYNLLEVYIDAVFYPNLNYLSFLQEGHRLEFLDENDPSSLSLTGVVYNEMKGSLSNPMRRLMQEVYTHLFPSSPYGYNSGGDPRSITSLSLKELISFHTTYYHPSRSLFFFYGNIPLTQHLDFLEEKLLSQTTYAPQLVSHPHQKRFTSPQQARTSYPATQEDVNQPTTFIAFSFLTTTIDNQLDCLALTLLDSMLLATDASPLKYQLLQTGMCRQVASSCDTEIPDVPFSIILTGCKQENAEALKKTLFTTLATIAIQGFSQKEIDASLHELEFAKSEITSDGSPFGLSLFWRTGLLQQHGVDPFGGLQIHALFDELRSSLEKDPSFFSKIINTYFLQNNHFVELIMTPSVTKEEEENLEEKRYLENTLSHISESERNDIIKNSRALKDLQEEHQDISCLPMLRLSDVPTTCKTISLHRESIGNVDLFSHTPFTNGICYSSIVFPLAHVDEEDLFVVKLFSLLLTQLGCGQRTYDQTLSDMQAYTGGVYASINLFPQATHAHTCSPSFVLKGKCLKRNLENLFSLLFDYLTAPRFDEKDRIQEVLEKHGVDLRNSFQSRTLDYAMSQAGRSIDGAHAMQEAMGGLSYFKKIQALLSSFSENEEWLFEKLNALASKIFHKNDMHVLFCGDDDSLLIVKENNLFGIAELAGQDYRPFSLPKAPSDEGSRLFITSTGVSSTCVILPTVSYTHPDAPQLLLLSALMNNTFLHKKIREQGGAYGGGASAQPISGTFSFYSYRDPQLYTTFQAYEQAGKWIEKGLFEEGELEEAKLSILQDLDAPIAPGHRAEIAYTWWRQGKSDASRQHFKDTLRRATKEDMQRLSRNYLHKVQDASFIAFTNKQIAETNRVLFENAHKPMSVVQV